MTESCNALQHIEANQQAYTSIDSQMFFASLEFPFLLMPTLLVKIMRDKHFADANLLSKIMRDEHCLLFAADIPAFSRLLHLTVAFPSRFWASMPNQQETQEGTIAGSSGLRQLGLKNHGPCRIFFTSLW